MALTAEIVALIIYAMDRAFEMYERQGMTREQIKEQLVKEITIYQTVKEQISSEIAKYGGR